MRWVIEMIETVSDDFMAVETIIALVKQKGYLGSRILKPSPSKPTWRIQAFFENDGIISGWLPDGCYYRLVPDSLLNGKEY